MTDGRFFLHAIALAAIALIGAALPLIACGDGNRPESVTPREAPLPPTSAAPVASSPPPPETPETPPAIATTPSSPPSPRATAAASTMPQGKPHEGDYSPSGLLYSR